MKVKNVDFELDVEQLDRNAEELQERGLRNTPSKRLNVRSTLISAKKDPRVSTTPSVSAPDLRLLEILKDGFKNPYVAVNWRIKRSDVEQAGVVGFNVFRRKISREKFYSQNRRKGETVNKFSVNAFDRISRGIPRRGKFSSERKGLDQVSRDLLPMSTVNSSLGEVSNIASSRFQSSLNRNVNRHSGFTDPLDGNQPVLNQSFFTNFLNDKRFKKVGHVSYSSFLAKEKKKFVSVINQEFVDLNFKDNNVIYGEAYEYYVTSVSGGVKDSVQSNVVQIFIEDLTPVRPPKQIFAQINSNNHIRVSVMVDERDNVDKVLVFRRAEGEVFFIQRALLSNKSDRVSFVDTDVKYGSQYIYRIFMKNIYGTLSEPKEIVVDVLRQRILPKTRSNNFKIPILSAVGDQGSKNIKLTIAANDSKISYYEIERRDLSIHERRFTVPGRGTNGYGGTGWKSNQISVNRERNLLNPEISSNKQVLNRRTSNQELVFIDDTVDENHIYQYRIRGRDLFGNVTPYALSTAKPRTKQKVRTPVNLRSEVLRNFPYRVKILWDDDNTVKKFSRQELFRVESDIVPDDLKFVYKVQRRKEGEHRYEEFPLNANQFLIDEVASRDAVPLQQKKMNDVFEVLPNVSVGVEQQAVRSVLRPFEAPSYIEPNETYFYRVAAVNDRGEESNFSEEFKISTISQLADPEKFKAEVVNLRVSPLAGKLTWQTSDTETRPDHWVIERKFDSSSDTFKQIGKAYLSEVFYDKDLQLGSSYIYRIKSIDNLGRESDFFEARLTL